MKTYKYSDPGGDYTLTEEQILAEYWEYWCAQMIRVGKSGLMTKERCIEDWITVNWATEVKND